MQPRDDGEPLRAALRDQHLTLNALAARTAAIDGYGVCKSAIGHLVATGPSRRTACAKRTAGLISQALNLPVESLFVEPVTLVSFLRPEYSHSS